MEMRVVKMQEEVKEMRKMGSGGRGWHRHLVGWTQVGVRGLSQVMSTHVLGTAGGATEGHKVADPKGDPGPVQVGQGLPLPTRAFFPSQQLS
jgi:hypothetical protein